LPFVVGFDEYWAGQAQQRGWVGEDSDDVGAALDFAPICRVLSEHGCPIAPRTFYAWLSRPVSQRALWDMTIIAILAGYYEPDEHGHRKPEALYGATKMWAHLHRQGIAVARCTVECLMRANGWQRVEWSGWAWR
jgi:putative transposase